ncbi:MAG TPA: metal-dependent transcriptional regulator [Longimicrobiales bacterium]|nr:metal-dependent transcriptional regulator [Longimicrobiales bacterium]
MGTGRLSRSVEDYLKAIFDLCESGDPASTTAIAVALDIQPASVSGMIKRLAEAGLLEYVPYRGVRLTERGVREALRVVRRHRILETYLCERLGYSWDDVHGEAERLEHAASDRLIERMAAALEFPRHDPHGAPIPTSGGHIETTNPSTLADARPGERVRIRAVRDEVAADLRSMEAEGLVPGTRVWIAEPQTLEGSVEFSLDGGNGEPRAILDRLARQIYVVPDQG